MYISFIVQSDSSRDTELIILKFQDILNAIKGKRIIFLKICCLVKNEVFWHHMLSLTNKNNYHVHNMNRYGKSLKESLGLYFFAPMEWEVFERGTHSKVGLISWPIFANSIVQNRAILQAFWECFFIKDSTILQNFRVL